MSSNSKSSIFKRRRHPPAPLLDDDDVPLLDDDDVLLLDDDVPLPEDEDVPLLEVEDTPTPTVGHGVLSQPVVTVVEELPVPEDAPPTPVSGLLQSAKLKRTAVPAPTDNSFRG